jgi:hypothetical protein
MAQSGQAPTGAALARLNYGLLRARRWLAKVGPPVLGRLPERSARAGLSRFLRGSPQLWGWSARSERRRLARDAYRCAFPESDDAMFVADFVKTRAEGLATSITFMTRMSYARNSELVDDRLPLPLGSSEPCIVTYLHYAIDPVLQLALVAGNPTRRFKWTWVPVHPNTPVQWEDERALFLAGGRAPGWIDETLLPVTDARWLVHALRHLKSGGSVMFALDTALDSRRGANTHLTIGQVTMPISPALELLRSRAGARLFFAWPAHNPDRSWSLHVGEFASIERLAAAASTWIDEYRLCWSGWHYLSGRRAPMQLRHGLFQRTPSEGRSLPSQGPPAAVT